MPPVGAVRAPGPDGQRTEASAMSRLQVTGAWTLLAVGLAALAVVAGWAQRGFWFVADEWNVLVQHVDGNLATPYNGHLSAIPVAIYQALAHTVGLGSYRPFGTVGILVYLAIPVALVLTHRRVVDLRLLVVAGLGIAWTGAGSTNLLYGFLINFDIPIVMLLVAWWLIRRDRLGTDLGAMAALAVALASSSVGLIAAVAVVTELVVARVSWRRLVRFAPPLVAWALWWLVRHEATSPASVGERVAYAWHMSVAILAGFTAGWTPGAPLVTVALVALGVVAHRRWGTVDAHVVGTLVALAAFVVLTAYSRAGDIALNPTDSPRYVFLGQFLLVAAALWCVRGRVVPWSATAGAAVVAVAAAVPLPGAIQDHRDFVLASQAHSRPFLAGAEAAGDAADPDRILPLNLIPVTVGEYLHMVDEVGSAVPESAARDLGDAASRAEADRILVTELGLTLAAAPAGLQCADGEAPGPVPQEGRALDPGATYLVRATGPSGVSVALRRYADPGSGAVIGELAGGEARLVATPGDDGPHRWWVEPAPGVEVCATAG